MIYLEYFMTAVIVVLLSIKASNYIDLLDKNTRLSGAFLGGVMLSAVTSLPELFTSISATLLLDKPGLCIGNIMGSDLFNLAAISIIMLMSFNGFCKGRISGSYRHVTLSVLCIYGLIGLNYLNIINVRVFHVSITTIFILVVYILGAKYLAIADDANSDEDSLVYQASHHTDLSVKQIGFRFFLSSSGIIAFSIILTYLTDQISIDLNLAQGLAGAILLGIATSLPEVSSTVTLFKMRNYNIAVGNIIGSNLFNFIILAIADLLAFGSSVYEIADKNTLNLLIFGLIATFNFWVILKFRNKTVQGLGIAAIIGSYIGFLVL